MGKPNLQKTNSRNCVIHALKQGRALCGFSRFPPKNWPDGHLWTRSSQQVTCHKCQKLVMELMHDGS